MTIDICDICGVREKRAMWNADRFLGPKIDDVCHPCHEKIIKFAQQLKATAERKEK